MIEEKKLLIVQIKKGDTNAFDRLFSSYYQPLLRFISSILWDIDAAEDILQDMFLNIWKTRERLDPTKNIESYLFRSAKNAALNYLRHKKVEKKYIKPFSLELFTVSNNAVEKEETEATFPSSEDQYINDFLKTEIQKALQSLPERIRRAFYLSRYEELSHTQIAEIMEISPKTVNNHIVQALKQLRKLLQHLHQK